MTLHPHTPIFNFTSDSTWGWSIQEITFTWATAQAATNTSSIAIYLNDAHASPGGFWDITIRRCNFNNGFRAISNNTSLTAPVWGTHISDCVFQGGMTGASVCLLPNPQIGQPRICIENCELDANNATEPLIQISASDTIELRSLEFLNGTAPVAQILIGGCPNITLINCRSENYNFGSAGGKALWNFSGSHVSVIGCTITGVLGTAGTQYALYATSGGVLNIDGLVVNSSMSGGELLPWFASEILSVSRFASTGNVTDNIRAYLGNVAVPNVYADAALFAVNVPTGK